MPIDQRKEFAQIRRFDQLVVYLRDELSWPIALSDFEELTFDYTPAELGIDAKNAAKILEIKRLRPLIPNQPWGIFFVKFSPKKLPVVVLRRILGRVAITRNSWSRNSEYQNWRTDDLLFVSNYGEGDARQIAFAHFSKSHSNDLPTLKVLGWNSLNTPLRLDAVVHNLTNYLTWPDDINDFQSWRERWRSAFALRHREVITSSKSLAERLAQVALQIRQRIQSALSIESKSGSLTNLMKAFQLALIHDLDETSFADMYAQTITYGLLSARITDPSNRTVDDLTEHMWTNPFLKDLMATFMKVGGYPSKVSDFRIDFDELGVSEVIELLDSTNIEAVVRDFGDLNPFEDPVIHFYERFLSSYDKEQKIRRGVFYTPRPIVSYIVKTIDKQLRHDFGIADGLADTITWKEISKRHTNIKVPEGTSPDRAFVRILDPSSGTGTFLVETIDVIHKTLTKKWRAKGYDDVRIRELWNDYVPQHLLPRLYGYEILMAPYAIAHLKISLKLFETGYRFGTNERARVYLTNALEPPGDGQYTFDFLPALAHEAKAVDEIKRTHRFTVVLGNPPYSIQSSNLSNDHKSLVERYRYVDGYRIRERGALQLEKNIQDDYVKFFALAEDVLSASPFALFGYVSNGNYLDASTLRGLRASLCASFDVRLLVDLHGDGTGAQVGSENSKDENLFDIKQGVSIGFFSRQSRTDSSTRRIDVGGTREQKRAYLGQGTFNYSDSISLTPVGPTYEFSSKNAELANVWNTWYAIDDLFHQYSAGVITARDKIVIAYNRHTLLRRMRELQKSNLSDTEFLSEFNIAAKKGWNVKSARDQLRSTISIEDEILPIAYRPFDNRMIYYNKHWVWGRAYPTMRHMAVHGNIAIAVSKQLRKKTDPWAHVFVCHTLGESSLVSNRSKEIASFFPMLLNVSMFDQSQPNVEGNISSTARDALLDTAQDSTQVSEILISYTYAVLHSSSYRKKFGELLARGFPRIPIPEDRTLAVQLVDLGRQLIGIHLLQTKETEVPTTNYQGSSSPTVDCVGWSDEIVWLNAGKTNSKRGYRAEIPGTIGFIDVPEEVWDFKIGSYQICYKWLKDRQGINLSNQDIEHYQRVITVIRETIRTMYEIDDVIEKHGGWPDAFQSRTEGNVKFKIPTEDNLFESR